jgi:hypothetical protein
MDRLYHRAMTPRLYFVLAFAGIGGGITLLASAYVARLGLLWQGVGALTFGLGMASLTLGLSDLLNPAPAEPEQIFLARDADGPWTPEDFPCPHYVPPAGEISIHHMPNVIDAAPDGLGFVVGYGDYISPILVTDDPWRLPHRQQLVLALRASPGAEVAEPMLVGHENLTGLMEDDFERYECRLCVTLANVLALRAGPFFAWTDEAKKLALPFAPTEEAIEVVWATLIGLARQHREAHGRYYDLIRQLSAAAPGSPEAESLEMELRQLQDVKL